MPIGPLELNGALSRVQDVAIIKQNEDNKATINQSNVQGTFQEEVEEHSSKVEESDDAERQNKKFDAREKGDNEYEGDGGKKKKKAREDLKDKVIVKGKSQHLDIKI